MLLNIFLSILYHFQFQTMAFVFSRDHMLSAASIPFPHLPYESDEALKHAFNEQFNANKKTIANGITSYWIHRKSDKEVYRYNLSLFAYTYSAGFEERKSIKPYLERILGSKDDVSLLLQKWLNEAFSGFKSINVKVIGDWDYLVEIDLEK